MFPRLFATEAQGCTLVITAEENINSLASRNLREEADFLLEQWAQSGSKNIVIDLGHAEYFGTYMLELIHTLWRRIRPVQGRLALFRVSDIGQEVLHVARLDTLWPICTSREEALRQVEGNRQQA